LCAKLKPLNLTWSCTSRVTTDRETLKAMKEAGCRLLIVGFESGDPQVLKNIKKGATVEKARTFAKDCRDLGLTVHGDFVLGLPGETKASIRNTINFAKTLDVETIQVSIAHAFPGTEFLRLRQGQRLHRELGGAGRRGRPPDGPHRVPRPAHRLRARNGASLLRRVLLPAKAAFRVIWKAIIHRDLPRLYIEAKAFLKLRAERNKMVKTARGKQADPPAQAGAGA